MSSRLVRLACLIAGVIALAQPVRAQSDLAADLLARINTLRGQSGLLPLSTNSQLTAAAQRLSSDMAVTGSVDHTASDGSTMDARIRASGFGYWRGFGIWAENIYGGQTATPDDAWNFWTPRKCIAPICSARGIVKSGWPSPPAIRAHSS